MSFQLETGRNIYLRRALVKFRLKRDIEAEDSLYFLFLTGFKKDLNYFKGSS